MTPARDPNDLAAHLFALAAMADPPGMFGRFHYVADPVAAMEILRETDVFAKDYGAIAFLGPSRFSTNGEEWRARRDLTQPGYQHQARPGRRPYVRETFEAALDRVDRDGAPSIGRLMATVTQVTAQFFLDSFALEADAVRLVAAFESFRPLLFEMQRGTLCDGADRDTLRPSRAVADELSAAFAAYCATEPAFGDLFARWERDYAGPAPLNARSEFLVNLFAGFESSTSAIGWTVDRMGANAALQERLRDEAQQAERPAFERFINEILRYFPPLPLTTRITTRAYSSPALTVPADANVLLSILGVHRHPSAWSEPLRFNPDRPEFAAGQTPRGAYIPFLSGVRTCGGAGLARMEVEEGASAILRRYRLSRPADAPVWFEHTITLRPHFTDAHRIARL